MSHECPKNVPSAFDLSLGRMWARLWLPARLPRPPPRCRYDPNWMGNGSPRRRRRKARVLGRDQQGSIRKVALAGRIPDKRYRHILIADQRIPPSPGWYREYVTLNGTTYHYDVPITWRVFVNLEKVSSLTEEQARTLIEGIRWPHGPVCVKCRSKDIGRIARSKGHPGLLQCRACKKQFTVTVGTIFERSHISLRKWVIAFHLMCSSKKGISAHQLHRNLGITYKCAWHMAHRIRHAMRCESLEALLRGKVEVDETYIGGKSRKGIRGRGSERKVPVVALIERGGRIRTHPVKRVSAKELQGAILANVKPTSTIMTDEFVSYKGIGRKFKGGHKSVNHGRKEYVRGDAHVNTCESYFALLKRGVHGTFHHVSVKHLFRYCDEFAFRWDHRKVKDGVRTLTGLRQAEGKRLTYYPLVN